MAYTMPSADAASSADLDPVPPPAASLTPGQAALALLNGTSEVTSEGSLLNNMSLTNDSLQQVPPLAMDLNNMSLASPNLYTQSGSPSKSRTLPPKPEMADVSLSARSFNERNLVSMRDATIGVTQQQVVMLTTQNASLRRSLNEVESEMITLQEALSSKDAKIHHKDKELEEIQRECASLMAEMQKNEGRENAMNLASKQNTGLLRLLEQEEAKRNVVTNDRDSLQMQLDVVRAAHTELTHTAAESEAKMKDQILKVRKRAHEVSQEAAINQTKALELQASLAETQRVAKFEISNMKDELMSRRDKVYELLEKLQVTEDKLRVSTDENERKDELLESSNERSNELDRRLNATRLELAAREEDLRVREAAFREEEENQRNREAALKSENDDLEKQMGELSTTVMQLVERHKSNQEVKRLDDERYAELNSEHELLREQQERLLESLSVKSKQYIQLEADHADAQDEIRKLKDGVDEEFASIGPQQDESVKEQESMVSSTTKAAKLNVKKLYPLEAAARRRMLSNFLVSVSHNTVVSTAISNRCIVEACQSLVLDECNIDDVDMITLVSVLKNTKTITELNLVSNRISDAGATALAGYISLGNCKLSFVDLRNNGISMNGIKKLSESIQNNVGRGIEHVYVHNDGRIDAIGFKMGVVGEEKKMEDGNDASSAAKIKNAMSSIIVVDVRENFPNLITTLPKPVGTENTVWSKIYDSLPSEDSLRVEAMRKKVGREREKNSEYRNFVVGSIYGQVDK
jgi:hypothetical protein